MKRIQNVAQFNGRKYLVSTVIGEELNETMVFPATKNGGFAHGLEVYAVKPAAHHRVLNAFKPHNRHKLAAMFKSYNC